MTLQIAARWFEFEHVGDGITRIWEPHVIRVMQCNIWHVRGRDRDLLIDTGMGISSLHEAARHLFDKPLAALATHTHLDHIGSLHEFAERIAHPAEAERLQESSENFSMLRDRHPIEFIESLELAGYEVGSSGGARDAPGGGRRRDRPGRPDFRGAAPARAFPGKHRSVGVTQRHTVLGRRHL